MKAVADPKKVYSAKDAMKFFPKVVSEPTFRKKLEQDRETENILGTMIVNRGGKRLFFLKGANIINYLRMKNFRYSRPQKPMNDNLFIMKSDFDHSFHETFSIENRENGKTYTFAREKIQELIDQGAQLIHSKPNFADGKPFVQLPMTIADSVE